MCSSQSSSSSPNSVVGRRNQSENHLNGTVRRSNRNSTAPVNSSTESNIATMGEDTRNLTNKFETRRRLIQMFYFVAFLDLLAVSLFIPFISKRMRELGATPFVTGLVGSTFGAIQLVSSPVVGWSSDRHGQKFILVVCLISSALAYTLQGFAFTIAMMFMARSLAGIFKHTQTIGRSIVSELSSKDKSYVIGSYNAFASMGFIIGPTVGAHIAQREGGFQTVCLISAGAFIFNAVLLMIFVPEPKTLTRKSFSSQAREKKNDDEASNIKDKDFHSIILLMVRFLFSLATLVVRENLTITLQDKYNTELVSIGHLTSMQGFMATTMGFTVGHVNSLIFRKNSLLMVVIVGVLKTAVLFTLFWSKSHWLAASMLISDSALNTFLRVGVTTVSLDGHENEIGTILGLGQSATSVARMVSPTLAGIAFEVSPDGPFLVAAISAVLGIIASVIAQRFIHRGRQHVKAD